MLTMMCQSLVFFYFSYLGFSELLESMGYKLGKILAIISSNLCPPIFSLIYFWGTNYMYDRLFTIVPVSQMLCSVFFLFHLCVFQVG